MHLEFDKSIAVLPFLNMSPNHEAEYFSDGITEEIINALTKIMGLKVTSRTSSFYFKNKNIPISKIGHELKVSTILEGSIRLSRDKVRITAQLIDVVDDFHFWSETFDRSVEDIFVVQDEISLLIADKLREHLGHFEMGNNLIDIPDIPVTVYQLFLKGRYHLMKLTKEGTETAIAIFSESLLSKDRSISCQSCHMFEAAFADHLPVGEGIMGRTVTRNTPTIFNVGWHPYFMADGKFATLEDQVLGPINDHREFDMNSNEVVERLKSMTYYKELSQEA